MFGRGRLLRENVNMREALSFYAAAANWRRRAINAKGMPKRWDKSPAAYDRGDRALAAILAIENARARRGVLQQLRNLFRRKPKPRQIHVPAPLTLTPPTPKASPCLDQPISSTEFSTTELPIDARSGRTVASVDTPAATP